MRFVALILILVLPVSASQLLIATISATEIYCSGAGNCSAYGTTVPDLANNTNWTIHYRIKRDFIPSTGSRQWMLSVATVGGFPTQYLCAQPMLTWDDISNVSMLMTVYVGVHGGLGITQVLQSSFDFANDMLWHDITLTHTSGHVWTLYIDGVQDSTTTSSQSIDSGCDVFIGAVDNFNSCGINPSGCFMIDVAAWSNVLPASDIKAMASCASRPNQVSIKPDYWIPQDGGYGAGGDGSGIADLSGNHHNASPSALHHWDYNDIPLKATNSSCSPATGEATH